MFLRRFTGNRWSLSWCVYRNISHVQLPKVWARTPPVPGHPLQQAGGRTRTFQHFTSFTALYMNLFPFHFLLFTDFANRCRHIHSGGTTWGKITSVFIYIPLDTGANRNMFTSLPVPVRDEVLRQRRYNVEKRLFLNKTNKSFLFSPNTSQLHKHSQSPVTYWELQSK